VSTNVPARELHAALGIHAPVGMIRNREVVVLHQNRLGTSGSGARSRRAHGLRPCPLGLRALAGDPQTRIMEEPPAVRDGPMPVRSITSVDLTRIRHLVPGDLGSSAAVWLSEDSELFGLDNRTPELISLYGDRKPTLFKTNLVPGRSPLSLDGGLVLRHLTLWQFGSIGELAAAARRSWWYGDFYVFSDPIPDGPGTWPPNSAGALTKALTSSLEGTSSFLHLALEFGGEVILYPELMRSSIERICR